MFMDREEISSGSDVFFEASSVKTTGHVPHLKLLPMASTRMRSSSRARSCRACSVGSARSVSWSRTPKQEIQRK